MKIVNAFSINLFPAGVSQAVVRYYRISGLVARDLVANSDIEPGIDHPDLWEVVRRDLGLAGEITHKTAALEVGEWALIAQYRGPRLGPGATELPADVRVEYWLAMIDQAEPKPAPLLPLDFGADAKRLGMPVDISAPYVYHVRFVGRCGEVAEVRGSKTEIAMTLIDAGYPAVVVEQTQCGRGIWLEPVGGFQVQPHNDNHWIATETLEQARDAYWHPEEYR